MPPELAATLGQHTVRCKEACVGLLGGAEKAGGGRVRGQRHQTSMVALYMCIHSIAAADTTSANTLKCLAESAPSGSI